MTARLRHDATAIEREVRRLAAEVSADHPDGLVLVALLPDALHLAIDLLRWATVPVEISTMLLSPYSPGTGRVRVELDLDVDVSGRRVVLATGAVDTGLRGGWVANELRRRMAASVRHCAVVDRPRRRIVPIVPDYVGFVTDDDLLVGYGLDLAGRGANLPALVAWAGRRPPDDPAAAVEACFRLVRPPVTGSDGRSDTATAVLP